MAKKMALNKGLMKYYEEGATELVLVKGNPKVTPLDYNDPDFDWFEVETDAPTFNIQILSGDRRPYFYAQIRKNLYYHLTENGQMIIEGPVGGDKVYVGFASHPASWEGKPAYDEMRKLVSEQMEDIKSFISKKYAEGYRILRHSEIVKCLRIHTEWEDHYDWSSGIKNPAVVKNPLWDLEKEEAAILKFISPLAAVV